MTRERINSLLLRIDSAFEGVPRPRITKSVARGYDDEWILSAERIEELARLDPENAWTDVTEEDIRHSQEYFIFSDAEGWRFYLPAHMKFYLLGFPNFAWSAVYDACTSPDAKFEFLTPEQRACVDAFVEIIHEKELSQTRLT